MQFNDDFNPSFSPVGKRVGGQLRL